MEGLIPCSEDLCLVNMDSPVFVGEIYALTIDRRLYPRVLGL